MEEKIHVTGSRIGMGILLLLWMGIIFAFSAQVADDSSLVSDGICYRIIELCNDLLGKGWNMDKKIELATAISFPVRKIAHMTEYAILAGLILGNIKLYRCQGFLGAKHFAASWLGAVFYACTDEYHQTFVPGRSGSPIDVGIDSIGAALGLMVLYGVMIGFRKRRKKMTDREA